MNIDKFLDKLEYELRLQQKAGTKQKSLLKVLHLMARNISDYILFGLITRGQPRGLNTFKEMLFKDIVRLCVVYINFEMLKKFDIEDFTTEVDIKMVAHELAEIHTKDLDKVAEQQKEGNSTGR